MNNHIKTATHGRAKASCNILNNWLKVLNINRQHCLFSKKNFTSKSKLESLPFWSTVSCSTVVGLRLSSSARDGPAHCLHLPVKKTKRTSINSQNYELKTYSKSIEHKKHFMKDWSIPIHKLSNKISYIAWIKVLHKSTRFDQLYIFFSSTLPQLSSCCGF